VRIPRRTYSKTFFVIYTLLLSHLNVTLSYAFIPSHLPTKIFCLLLTYCMHATGATHLTLREMVKITNHEIPQCAIFSSLLWLSSSQFQVFPLGPLSQAPSLFLKIVHFYTVKYCRIGQNIFTLSKYSKFSGLSRGVNHVGEKCNENKCSIIPNT